MRVVSLSQQWAQALRPLLDSDLELVVAEDDHLSVRDEVLAQAEVLVTGEFTADMGRACRKLRLLVCPLAGTEQIDRAALGPNVRLIKGTGHEIPMAEYVLGCLVALRQRILEADDALRKGRWEQGYWASGSPLDELCGSTLGIVGFGRIGGQIAKRAFAFEMRCAAATLHASPERQADAGLDYLADIADPSEVDRLAAWSDALVLCCELSPLTEGILDERRFKLMKPNAIVINVSRGPVVREPDLYEALAAKRIAGAAIDVWYRYPKDPEHGHADSAAPSCFPSRYPFHELHNVIMTPHSSAWTEAARQRRVVGIANAINEFARSAARA